MHGCNRKLQIIAFVTMHMVKETLKFLIKRDFLRESFYKKSFLFKSLSILMCQVDCLGFGH